MPGLSEAELLELKPGDLFWLVTLRMLEQPLSIQGPYRVEGFENDPETGKIQIRYGKDKAELIFREFPSSLIGRAKVFPSQSGAETFYEAKMLEFETKNDSK